MELLQSGLSFLAQWTLLSGLFQPSGLGSQVCFGPVVSAHTETWQPGWFLPSGFYMHGAVAVWAFASGPVDSILRFVSAQGTRLTGWFRPSGFCSHEDVAARLVSAQGILLTRSRCSLGCVRPSGLYSHGAADTGKSAELFCRCLFVCFERKLQTPVHYGAEP